MAQVIDWPLVVIVLFVLCYYTICVFAGYSVACLFFAPNKEQFNYASLVYAKVQKPANQSFADTQRERELKITTLLLDDDDDDDEFLRRPKFEVCRPTNVNLCTLDRHKRERKRERKREKRLRANSKRSLIDSSSPCCLCVCVYRAFKLH